MNAGRFPHAPLWWAAAVATGGNVMIGAGAFWLSFTALSDLARMAGVPEHQAWAWAVIVDGLIVISTVAVVALDGHGWRAVAYPWTLLACSAGVSVVANILHAIVQAPPSVPAPLAGAIAAVPPATLIATTHLNVLLIRHAIRTPRPEPQLAPEPERAEAPRLEAQPEPTAVSESPAPAAVTAPERPAPRPRPARTARTDRQPGAREQALELFAQGWSSRKIAAEIGVHRSTVSRWVAPAVPDHDSGESVGVE